MVAMGEDALQNLLFGLIFTLSGVVIGSLTTAAYFRSRYRDIRNAVGKGSFQALVRLLNEHSRYITLLDDALNSLDVAQEELSTTRTRVADTREWIQNTTVEVEALRGLEQMPPVLKNDSPARGFSAAQAAVPAASSGQ
jgi:hypothetical protein